MRIDEIRPNQTAGVEVTVTAEMIDRFAELSGDVNPLHMDPKAAAGFGMSDRVAHGVLTLSFLSRLIGMDLPGTGALWQSLKIEWVRPVFPGDTVTLEARVSSVSPEQGLVLLEVSGRNQNQMEILRGQATVGVRASDSPASAESNSGSTQPTMEEVGGGSHLRRCVFVTGGSGGIGRNIALKLGRRGFAVAVGYRGSKEKAEEVVEQIVSSGNPDATAVRCDVERAEDIDRAMADASAALGPVLAIVHAATPPLVTTDFESQELDVLERYYRAYVLGGMRLAQNAARAIREHKWGRLVFIGTSAICGAPPAHMAGYIAAKHGLLGLTKSLAVEMGPLGATANMVSPGMTKTELTRYNSERMFLRESQNTPVRRIAEPDDTANVVSYLLSDEASFINGANIQVSGGLTMA